MAQQFFAPTKQSLLKCPFRALSIYARKRCGEGSGLGKTAAICVYRRTVRRSSRKIGVLISNQSRGSSAGSCATVAGDPRGPNRRNDSDSRLIEDGIQVVAINENVKIYELSENRWLAFVRLQLVGPPSFFPVGQVASSPESAAKCLNRIRNRERLA